MHNWKVVQKDDEIGQYFIQKYVDLDQRLSI